MSTLPAITDLSDDESIQSQSTINVKIFSAAGYTPDVRIRLFDMQELHLHSIVLKLYSTFFRKFLDSPEKTFSNTTAFKYEWVSEIEEDGSWHLVALQSLKNTGGCFSLYPKNKQYLSPGQPAATAEEIQIDFIIKMFGSMYHIPFWADATILNGITKLADYYRCLPIVSHNILNSNVKQKESFLCHAEEIIESAYKLRHTELFRDCVTMIAGDMTFINDEGRDASKNIITPEIQACIKLVRQRNLIALVTAQTEVMAIAYRDETFNEILRNVDEHFAENRSRLPMFFRKYYTAFEEWCLGNDEFNGGDKYDAIYYALDELLYNRLHLGSSFKAGSNLFPTNLFCSIIYDSEIPWDRTETDW